MERDRLYVSEIYWFFIIACVRLRKKYSTSWVKWFTESGWKFTNCYSHCSTIFLKTTHLISLFWSLELRLYDIPLKSIGILFSVYVDAKQSVSQTISGLTYETNNSDDFGGIVESQTRRCSFFFAGSSPASVWIICNWWKRILMRFYMFFFLFLFFLLRFLHKNIHAISKDVNMLIPPSHWFNSNFLYQLVF